MLGYTEHADFQVERPKDSEHLWLIPLTLRAVEWLKEHCDGYETQETERGFIAPAICVFADRVERVLEKIRHANLRVNHLPRQ